MSASGLGQGKASCRVRDGRFRNYKAKHVHNVDEQRTSRLINDYGDPVIKLEAKRAWLAKERAEAAKREAGICRSLALALWLVRLIRLPQHRNMARLKFSLYNLGSEQNA